MSPKKRPVDVARAVVRALTRPMSVKIAFIEIAGPAFIVMSAITLFVALLAGAGYLLVRHPEIIGKIIEAI